MSLYQAEAIAIPFVGACLLLYAWIGSRLIKAILSLWRSFQRDVHLLK